MLQCISKNKWTECSQCIECIKQLNVFPMTWKLEKKQAALILASSIFGLMFAFIIKISLNSTSSNDRAVDFYKFCGFYLLIVKRRFFLLFSSSLRFFILFLFYPFPPVLFLLSIIPKGNNNNNIKEWQDIAWINIEIGQGPTFFPQHSHSLWLFLQFVFVTFNCSNGYIAVIFQMLFLFKL